MKMKKKINITTGLGYFKNENNQIVAKFELPIGAHIIKSEYNFVEVASKAELNQIIVAAPPVSENDIWRQKVQKEIFLMAEESLELKGEKKPVKLAIK